MADRRARLAADGFPDLHLVAIDPAPDAGFGTGWLQVRPDGRADGLQSAVIPPARPPTVFPTRSESPPPP